MKMLITIWLRDKSYPEDKIFLRYCKNTLEKFKQYVIK